MSANEAIRAILMLVGAVDQLQRGNADLQTH
jgi:hypothetical protein